MARVIETADKTSVSNKDIAVKAFGITMVASATALAARTLLEFAAGLEDLTAAELDQVAAIGATTISAAQWALLGGLASTAAELAQLEAIGATTISAAQWAILGGITEQAEILDELTTLTHEAAGTPDYAIQAITNTTPFGFVTADEGTTVLMVVANNQARITAIENALVALGLLADAD